MKHDLTGMITDNTIFLSVIGSHAYGTNLPSSDEDMGGVCIIPDKSYYIGDKNFELKDSWVDESGNKIDKTIFSIRKIVELCIDNNPNCLDYLFSPERCHRIVLPQWKKFLDIRDEFISSKIRFTLAGYAHSQIHRIKNHRQFLLNPKNKPERADFGLPEVSEFPPTQMEAIARISTNFIDQDRKKDFHNESVDIINREFYLLYLKYMDREMANMALNDFRKDQINWFNMLCSIQSIFLKDEWIEKAQKELKFLHAKKEYDAYLGWKNTRNEKRKLLEEKCHYDCYSDDTEFLTESGFKKFDEIKESDKLATMYVNFTKKHKNTHKQEFSIEYQKYTERIDGKYTGNMYNFFGYHTDIMVTANHNMLIHEYARNVGKYFGDWRLEQASNLPDSFDVFYAPLPKKKNYCDNMVFDGCPISRMSFIGLMGWFLSDGTLLFRKGKVTSIRISQKKEGKLYWKMSRFLSENAKKISCYLYEYTRKPNKFNPNSIQECSLSISDKWLRERIFSDCGHSEKKRIPLWVYSLSSRMQKHLLMSMMGGDGTHKKLKTEEIDAWIYYSKSKELADDVQRLAFMCGYKTSVWGPYKETNKGYELEMYQVYVDVKSDGNKMLTCNNNIKKIPVENQRIVCFTVPNSTLVTRRNGHITIQGNCKFACHAIRLLRLGHEVLTGKNYNVDRTNIDAEELIDIRLGNKPFDYVIGVADNLLVQVEEAYKTTKLRKSADREKIQGMLQETIEEYVWNKK